jgi:hypothetical protein
VAKHDLADQVDACGRCGELLGIGVRGQLLPGFV